MKSLVLSRFSPFSTKGGAALRNGQTVAGLARLGEVDVVTIGEDPDARDEQRGPVRSFRFGLGDSPGALRRIGKKLWRVTPGAVPVIDMYRQESVLRFLRDRCREQNYDVAVVEELSLGRYLPLLDQLGCPTVFDAHNVEGVLRRELGKAGGEGGSFTKRMIDRRIFGLERHMVSRAGQVWVCSEVDANQLAEVYGRREGVSVIPNGVNTTDYADARVDRGGWDDEIELLFLGSYSYYPNEEAALTMINELVPELRARGRSVRLKLVGRQPTPAMLEAAGGDDQIEVTGGVESVVPYLARSSVMVVPLTLGSGTRLKILEAFAAGKPVVSTTKGAEGIDYREGSDLFIADDPAAMADAVIRIWDDRELRDAMRRSALELVERDYSWESAGRRIAGLFDSRQAVQAARPALAGQAP